MVEWCTQYLRRGSSISRCTSHATTKQRHWYTISVDINNTRYKRIQSLIQNHKRHVRSESSRVCSIKAMNNNNNILDLLKRFPRAFLAHRYLENIGSCGRRSAMESLQTCSAKEKPYSGGRHRRKQTPSTGLRHPSFNHCRI